MSNNTPENRQAAYSLPMPEDQFLGWGVGDIAYVRAVTVGEQVGFAVIGADGRQLGMAPNPQLAYAAIVQHEMEPVSLH